MISGFDSVLLKRYMSISKLENFGQDPFFLSCHAKNMLDVLFKINQDMILLYEAI